MWFRKYVDCLLYCLNHKSYKNAVVFILVVPEYEKKSVDEHWISKQFKHPNTLNCQLNNIAVNATTSGRTSRDDFFPLLLTNSY